MNAAARLPDVKMQRFPFVETFPRGNGAGVAPAFALMCVRTQVLTGPTLNPDMFWKENLHGYVVQTF